MIGIELGAQGPNYGVASACAAGSHALGTAFRHMQALPPLPLTPTLPLTCMWRNAVPSA